MIIDLVDSNPNRSVVKVTINSIEKKFEIKGHSEEALEGNVQNAKEQILEFPFSAADLKEGGNIVTISVLEGGWIVFDQILLEGSDRVTLGDNNKYAFLRNVAPAAYETELEGKRVQPLLIDVEHLNGTPQLTVKLDGTDIRELSYKKSAQSIAVLAQHNYYNFEFSVQDVVLMGRSPHKRAMERDNAQDYAIVAQALETVGMADMAKRSFSTLSGGEQQRVILARALAQQTPCLILDEPTNHLDITYQLELMDIVQGLGRTVVAAIHDLNIAAMYCTRLFVMEKGLLVASGTPEEVLTPELIRQVYGVKAKVFRDEAGILRIQYYPEGRKEI